MSLSYKNYSKDEILRQVRNIDYASGINIYGNGNNNIELISELVIDIQQIKQQADIAARQLLVYKSDLDFKRVLGNKQEDWLRLLHEAYVYDRCKCIYYGVNSIYRSSNPSDSYSFIGNVLMLNVLKTSYYQFSTNCELPYNLYLNIKLNRKDDFLKPILTTYSNLSSCVSTLENNYEFMNYQYESILRGLYNLKLGSDRRNIKRDSLYEIVKMDDDKCLSFLVEDQFPFMNSFLTKDGKGFNFIFPTEKSKPEFLKHNESVFISRALGFRSEGLFREENNIYKKVPRKFSSDIFTYNEVYSITGIKTELTPSSVEFIDSYLGISSKDDKSSKGGKDSVTP